MKIKEYNWISTRSIMEIQQEPNCIFAGITGALPEEIEKNLNEIPTKTYCVICER